MTTERILAIILDGGVHGHEEKSASDVARQRKTVVCHQYLLPCDVETPQETAKQRLGAKTQRAHRCPALAITAVEKSSMRKKNCIWMRWGSRLNICQVQVPKLDPFWPEYSSVCYVCVFRYSGQVFLPPLGSGSFNVQLCSYTPCRGMRATCSDRLSGFMKRGLILFRCIILWRVLHSYCYGSPQVRTWNSLFLTSHYHYICDIIGVVWNVPLCRWQISTLCVKLWEQTTVSLVSTCSISTKHWTQLHSLKKSPDWL